MNGTSERRGFTLIEVLVASLLLGMLVTILTMVFNQSAIAWRTGKAGVAQLSETRNMLSVSQNRADNILPRVDDTSPGVVGQILSAWNEEGQVRQRAVGKVKEPCYFSVPSFSSYQSSGSGNRVQPWTAVTGLKSLQSGSAKNYIVGVLSLGPDGKRDTEDDITSWPGEID